MSRERLIELDGLRGMAALWVVIYHFTSGVSTYVGHDAALAFTPTVGNSEGVMAVHLFFIISGFVITLTVARCRTVMDFVAGRIARLFPAYWVAVLLAMGAGALMPIPGHLVTPSQGLVNLTMLQEFVGVADVNPSFWPRPGCRRPACRCPGGSRPFSACPSPRCFSPGSFSSRPGPSGRPYRGSPEYCSAWSVPCLGSAGWERRKA